MTTTLFIDIHTHHLPSDTQTTAILNCSMTEYASTRCKQSPFISISLHPWYLSTDNLHVQTEWMTQVLLSDKRIVALGEAGLDKMCPTPFQLQQTAFQAVIRLSEEHHLPLIIHSVKSTGELIALKKKYHPRQPWIIHGFRGKKELAEELIRHEFYLSFGKKYQKEALSAVPSNRLLLESDEATIDFPTFCAQVATLRETSTNELLTTIKENANLLFFNR